jgi:endonuclease/exonuclease/phosphatase family metal-dependent hydrolase
MLQEVTAMPRVGDDPATSVLAGFRARLSATHELHVSEKWVAACPYFIAMFVRRGLLLSDEVSEVALHDFPGSRMMRGYVLVSGVVAVGKGAARRKGKVCFVTSHLESERSGAEQRKAQLAAVVALMRRNAENGVATIFGGDTNLRETEVPAGMVAKTPEAEKREREGHGAAAREKAKLGDAFVQAGAPSEEKYTWDMLVNDNLDMSGLDFKPRSRYDRLFVFGPADVFPVCTGWKLIGKGRLECGVFCSDHWGIVADLRVPVAGEEVGGAKTETADGKRNGKGKGRGAGKGADDDGDCGGDDANADKGKKRTGVAGGAGGKKAAKIPRSGSKRRQSEEDS